MGVTASGGHLPRAALFDLDGTLIDSEPRSIETWRRLFAAHGLPYDDSVVRRFMGRRGPDVIAEDPDLFGNTTWEELIAELREIGRAPDLPPVRHLPESVEFLRRLHAQGVPIGLVTSAGREWAEFALSDMGVREMFGGLVTAADVVLGKPDPQGYLAGADILGHPPERTVVFEDTPAGIQAGGHAGMRVVAVTTTHPRAALGQADLVVDHLTEVDWPQIRPLAA
ncbi:sugar-phosphatase [Lipingzhangella halophila]|uniref:Sugar-phosphatase n=1 Tax=Lipingzhangella halophila TaxID=1783352 RepID=A0A7W7RKW1_9ACTN|nr:HAD family phosphatase [Lipingzhangella halophila]MBB4933864.1 sugar-phosphatase [Lipingzhangella halophila]